MNRKLKRKKILAFDLEISAKTTAKTTDQSECESEICDKQSPVNKSVGVVKKKLKIVKMGENASDDGLERDNVKKKKRQPSPPSSNEEDDSQIGVKQEATLFSNRRSFPSINTNLQHVTFASPQVMHWNKNTIKPLYKNHQLIGDSQLVRFAKQILHEKSADNRNIGYCVSGQKIEDLYNLLIHKTFEIHENVIMLIGTNNLTRHCHSEEMSQNYVKILQLLKPQTKRIVLLTVPPVQKICDSIVHWKTFEEFNKFILRQHDGQQIFVVDFGKHLIGYSGPTGSREYYEETYLDGRMDLIHLNRKGFLMLKFLLDIHYFGV